MSSNNSTQLAIGAMLCFFGLMIIAMSFQNPVTIFNLGGYNVSYGFIGMIAALIGMYFLLKESFI